MACHVFLLLSLVLAFHASQAKLEVDAEPRKIVAKPGEKVQLKCLLTGIKQPFNMKDFMIQWYTRGKQVAEYDNKIIIDKPGLSMSLEALQKGDATLTIDSVTEEHSGNFRCYVYYAADHIMKQVELLVEDPSKPKVEVEESFLTTCDSILDKKLDKVIDWFTKVDGKLDEVNRKCSGTQRIIKSNK
ncbi:obscurin-like [Mixophyes fleayi]|uniref:obscurin-like n=1 Tax=Mixophyes fleayi TaxID=3061075 RepID=UPI003F4DAE69